MLVLVMVATCLGLLVCLLLGGLAWAFNQAAREAGIFGMPEALDDAEDEAEMLARYQADIAASAKEQRARLGLEKEARV